MSKSSFITIYPLGATLGRFEVGGINLVLAYPTEELNKANNFTYWGQTIGRIGNRVDKGKLRLNGQEYNLPTNERGINTLHGGKEGWGRKQFTGPKEVERNGKSAELFTYTSPHMEEGFPGTVELRVWYTPDVTKTSNGAEKRNLEIEYEVEMVGDEVEETAVNVTNHSFWNITGQPTVEGTEMTLATVQHQPVEAASQIPTGEITAFPGLTADESFTIGAKEPFIDHCFILNTEPASVKLDTRSQPMQKMISLYHPESKIHLEVASTDPAFQVYTGDGINTKAVEGSPAKGPRAGIAIEPSRYVDAASRDEWKGMVVLKKGQVWGSKMSFTGWKE